MAELTDDKQYVYAVARLKIHELGLFNSQNLQDFSAAKDINELKSLLKEKNWGEENDNSIDEILISERKKLWSLIDELVPDKSVFDVFRLKNDYHNLKAAIKQSKFEEEIPNIYIKQTTIDIDKIKNIIKDRNYSNLPDDFVEPVSMAHDIFLKTGDSQKSDSIIDKYCLDAIYKSKLKTDNDFLKLYAELVVASTDIKIAYRGILTNKTKQFFDESIAECDTIDKNKLINSALQGKEAFYNYLNATDYAEAVEELKNSPSNFEKWCNNLIISQMKNELYNSFGLGPIAAYILAKENEIKSIKIIACGIENKLSMDDIKERLCDTYV